MHRLDRLEGSALKPQQLKRSTLNQLVQIFCHKIASGVTCQAVGGKKGLLRDILELPFESHQKEVLWMSEAFL
jgi:hypothetical protein